MAGAIKVIKGDITEMAVDAIVNAANNELKMGAGVAGAIRKKGGQSIQDECDKKAPIPIGEAVITGAGNLKAKHVIHAAVMEIGGKATEESIRKCVENSLKRADEHSLTSVAFPAFGAGIGGFPVERTAQIMIEEVKKHFKTDTTVNEVTFVLFDDTAFQAFKNALNGG